MTREVQHFIKMADVCDKYWPIIVTQKCILFRGQDRLIASTTFFFLSPQFKVQWGAHMCGSTWYYIFVTRSLTNLFSVLRTSKHLLKFNLKQTFCKIFLHSHKSVSTSIGLTENNLMVTLIFVLCQQNEFWCATYSSSEKTDDYTFFVSTLPEGIIV